MSESLKNQDNELISKRWAQALMDIVCEGNNISKYDILDDLKEIDNTINSSEELKNVINNPSISTEEKQIVLCKLFQNGVMPIVYNFIFTLNLKKRMNLIGNIAKEYEKLLDKMNNIKHIHIISAINIKDEEKRALETKIASKLNSQLITEWSVESSIIGGLIFNIDGTVIDNSIRHKLEDIQKSIGVNLA